MPRRYDWVLQLDLGPVAKGLLQRATVIVFTIMPHHAPPFDPAIRGGIGSFIMYRPHGPGVADTTTWNAEAEIRQTSLSTHPYAVPKLDVWVTMALETLSNPKDAPDYKRCADSLPSSAVKAMRA